MRYRHRSDITAGLEPRELAADPTNLKLYVGQPSGGTATEMLPYQRHSALASYTAGDQVVVDGITYCAKDDLTPGAFDKTQWNRLTEITPFDFGARANGTFDDTAALQAAIDEAAALSGDESGDGYFVEIDLKGANYTVTQPLLMSGSSCRGVILRNGKLAPHADSTWAVDGSGRATGALIVIENGAARNAIRDLNLACGFKTNGVLKQGSGNWTTVDGCYIAQPEYWGVRYTGGGAMFVTSSRIVERLDSVPDVGSRKARGIWLQAGDSKVFQNIVNWCEYPLYCDFNEDEGASGSAALISDNHFYNGSPFEGKPVVNPAIIYIGAGANGCYFSGNYYDNGRIIIRSRKAVFLGGRFALMPAWNTLESYFTLQPNATQADFRRLKISGPFDWPAGTTTKFLKVDETEATFTGNKAAMEASSPWSTITLECITQTRNQPDADPEDGDGPYAVHAFGSTSDQSRIVFSDNGTVGLSRNFQPYIGSRGENLTFGPTGNTPVWEVFPDKNMTSGAFAAGVAPSARFHLFGNGESIRITQECIPVESGAAGPTNDHYLTGNATSAGYRAFDKDFLVSGLPQQSHGLRAVRNAANIAAGSRVYSFTFSVAQDGTVNATDVLTIAHGSVHPASTNTKTLGKAANLWSQVYAATASISTSDERAKEQIQDVPHIVLDAWGLVRVTMFKYIDAVAAKGAEARWHFSPIAQEIQAAFASKGLDAADYGLFCYDAWGPEYDENGTLIRPEGNAYGLRYSECLMLEMAYTRRELSRIVDILNS